MRELLKISQWLANREFILAYEEAHLIFFFLFSSLRSVSKETYSNRPLLVTTLVHYPDS